MKRIEIIKVASYWSEKKLLSMVTETANAKLREGYQVLGVSFNLHYGYVAYITLQK